MLTSVLSSPEVKFGQIQYSDIDSLLSTQFEAFLLEEISKAKAIICDVPELWRTIL